MKKSFFWFLIVVAAVLFTIFLRSSSVNYKNLPQGVPGAQLEKDVLQVQKALPKNIFGEVTVVKRVIDGDTVELGTGERVRYIGMDTPETVDPRKPVQCFGREASTKNKGLVEGKVVVLEKDISETDKYGRLLRYVWTGKKMVNMELVEEGYATAFTYPPDVKYSKEFVAAERRAREAKIGLWKLCR